MRSRPLWAVLFVATACSGGCAAPRAAVPVRPRPDEMPRSPAADRPTETGIKPVGGPQEPANGVVPASLEVSASSRSGACAVFYTGGGLGAGEYALRHDLRVTEAIALAHGPLHPGLVTAAPTRVTVLRPSASGTGPPSAILVDLNEARRDPRENILVRPGDTITTPESGFEATGRVAGQLWRATIRLPVRLLTGGAGP